MARSFTITQDGVSRSFTVQTGVGPAGPAGSDGANGTNGTDATVTAANVASAINGTSEKTTPVDSDVLSLLDSAASWAMKKSSWSNIKATLKLYFDTLYVAVSQLSTTGGANKVAQFDADAFLTTGPVNTNTTTDPGGGLVIPALQRIRWDNHDGDPAADVWIFPNHPSNHDANYYPELVWTSARHCWYFTDTMQIGDAPTAGNRSWRNIAIQPLGMATAAGTYLGGTLDTQMESGAVCLGSNFWNGSAATTNWAGVQYCATGAGAGDLTFHVGGAVTPGGASARGRLLASSGYANGLTVNAFGPLIPTGKTLQAAGDFTLTQNSVSVLQSDSASALANTVRITNGKVRIGTGSSSVAAVPFEVWRQSDAGNSTGEFYVDSNGKVFVGRLSSTGGNSSAGLTVQDRSGNVIASFNPATSASVIGTSTLVVSSVSTFSNATDATSATAAAVKFTGGIGVAKGIYLGTILTGTEQASEPAAPAANGFVIYAIDDGAGKTKLMAKFASGAAQQIAIEP